MAGPRPTAPNALSEGCERCARCCSMRGMRKAMISVVAVGLVGCGGSLPPNDKIASSEAAVRAAQEVGAQNEPKAALHLKLAQEQLERAKGHVKEGENDRAEFELLRAKADAELAVELAREAAAKKEAQEVLEQVEKLKNNKN